MAGIERHDDEERGRKAPGSEPADAPPPPRTWLAWLERLVTIGLILFVLYRLGPQLGALAGVGPDLGRTPEYTVVTLDGDTIRSEDLHGRVVVLNFWATWCAPCRIEMPSLQSLHEDRAEDGVVVIGLSTDVGSEAPIREWVEERGFDFPSGGRRTPTGARSGASPASPPPT